VEGPEGLQPDLAWGLGMAGDVGEGFLKDAEGTGRPAISSRSSRSLSRLQAIPLRLVNSPTCHSMGESGLIVQHPAGARWRFCTA
jgi:hypothetical protein